MAASMKHPKNTPLDAASLLARTEGSCSVIPMLQACFIYAKHIWLFTQLGVGRCLCSLSLINGPVTLTQFLQRCHFIEYADDIANDLDPRPFRAY